MCSAPYVTSNCFLIADICKKFEEQRPILFCNCSDDLTVSPSNSWWIMMSLFPEPNLHDKKSAFFAILVALDIISDFLSFFYISNHSVIFVPGKGKKSRGARGIEFFVCLFFPEQGKEKF